MTELEEEPRVRSFQCEWQSVIDSIQLYRCVDCLETWIDERADENQTMCKSCRKDKKRPMKFKGAIGAFPTIMNKQMRWSDVFFAGAVPDETLRQYD